MTRHTITTTLRTMATAAIIVVGAVAPATVAAAGPGSPAKDPKWSVTARPRPLPALPKSAPATAAKRDDCAQLHANLPALAKSGAQLAACVTESTVKRDRPTTMAILPMPDWCVDNFDGNWWYDREVQCQIASRRVDVIRVPDGTLVGQIFYDMWNYSYTSPSASTWAQQMQLDVWHVWGEGVGASVSGGATCGGDCQLGRVSFPTQPATIDKTVDVESYFNSTATARGAVGRSTTEVSYRFTNPKWTSNPSTVYVIPPFAIRCDNAVPGPNPIPGCVVPDWAPIMTYSATGPYEELATHILAAQESGLPGSHPDYGLSNPAPLNRLVDEYLQGRNRSTACPDSWTRPAGLSCDEYPMASTRQGAFTAGGPGRTFDGCQVPLSAGTGPSGFSSCMIDDTENSTGGTALGTFLTNQRVLDNDAYYVWITP